MMERYEQLKSLLAETGGVVIGYSGGVDSTLLAKAATDALGHRAVCVLIESCLVPERDTAEAVGIADRFGFNLIRIREDVLSIDGVPENDPDRCYHCKKALFGQIAAIAREMGIAVVADGANVDDEGDYRPGSRATAELGVRSPLKELGLGKAEIRQISREIGLPTWNKPAYACLASRVPYGVRLTPEILTRVERAEAVLRELRFGQFRVRHHGDLARIELTEEDLSRVMQPDVREAVVRDLKALGYAYVSLDLTGYRTGSMNEVLSKD